MSILQRLPLALLLILLFFGSVGHALLPADGPNHLQSESDCVFHQGVNAPESLQLTLNKSGILPPFAITATCAFDLTFRIPHPPTF